MNFPTSLPPSFLEAYSLPAGSISGIGKDAFSIPLSDVNFSANPPISIADAYSGKFDLPSLGGKPAAWTFITAPEDVSWDIANQSNRVDIFGTNNPPVVAGSRGMRDLTLGNALVEGFVRKVSVEAKVASLENLLNYSLNASDGFVSVPVYQVWANSKSYGGSNAFFIIKDVKVNESMRDLKGNTTRAKVDISLMQVPAYQVNSGRDQASATSAGARSFLDGRGVAGDANQKVAGAANKGGTAATNAAAKPNGGVGVPNGGTGFKSKTGGTPTLTDELPLTSRTN